MTPARIAELLQPFLDEANDRGPTADDLNHISTYIDLLLRWNARINLTAIRNPEQIVTRHFGESLFAARHLFPASGEGHDSGRADVTVADVGSGAGFPGIPIKLWAPDIFLTLIESNHKKATFLREVARVLTLTNINVFHGRAERLIEPPPKQPPAFGLVTLRAVERFTSILPVAASLVSPGGRLALLIGSSQLDQARALLPTLTWDHPLPIPLSQSRSLLIGHSPQDPR